MAPTLKEMIDRAPWREAVTCRETWPHDYVLNRARLYRDRRDFVIQPGDSGKPENYPVNPPYIAQAI